MARLLFSTAGELRFAVLGYVPVIAAMGVSSLMILPILGAQMAVIGAMLFVVSDLVLSLEMFVLRDGGRAKKVAPFVVWPTYWVAIVLLLLGFLASQG